MKTWRVAFEAQYGDGTQIVNAFGIKDDAVLAGDLRSAHQICDELDSWLNLKWRNCAFNDVTLVDIKATEVKTKPEIGQQYVKTINLSGTLGTEDGKGSKAQCLWSKSSTGVPVKGAHGGWHGPPWNHSAFLGGDGLWLTSSAGWTAIGDFNTTLLGGRDYGVALGHLSYIILADARRQRGQLPYEYDVSGMSRARAPHFLRSRLTTP